MKSIYNVRSQQKAKKYGGFTLVQHVFRLVSYWGYIYYTRNVEGTMLGDLMSAHPQPIEKWLKHGR